MVTKDRYIELFREFLTQTPKDELVKLISQVDQMSSNDPTFNQYFDKLPSYLKIQPSDVDSWDCTFEEYTIEIDQPLKNLKYFDFVIKKEFKDFIRQSVDIKEETFVVNSINCGHLDDDQFCTPQIDTTYNRLAA